MSEIIYTPSDKVRYKANLINNLPEKLIEELKSIGVWKVIVKYENYTVVYNRDHVELPAPKHISSAVRKLENKDRQFIKRNMQRYYNTRNEKRLLMLERDIQLLEQEHFERYAYMIDRNWIEERKR